MAAGTLVYSGGLVGTQPAFISSGGSTAVVAGKPQVPLIQNISVSSRKSTSITIEVPYDASAIIKLSSGGGTVDYDVGGLELTFGGNTVNVGLNGSDSLNRDTGPLNGEYLLELSSGSNTISLNNEDNGAGTAPTLSLVGYILNSKDIDHINDESNTTLRHHTSDLANPETGFASFGSEFDATQYDNTADYDDANSSTINQYIVAKFSGLSSNYSNLYPLFNLSVSDTGPGSVVQNFYIWNFTNEGWDTLYSSSYSESGGTSATLGHTRYIPYGKVVDYSADYVESGVCYTKVIAYGSSTSSSVGFIGLKQINLIQNNG